MNLLDAAAQLAPWWERFGRGERPLPLPTDGLDFPLLGEVQRKFGLTDAEISIVLILGLVEMNARTRLTLEDLAEIFPGQCDARLLMAGAPLRRWRLIELAPNRFHELPLVTRRLALNERLLAHLLGETHPTSGSRRCSTLVHRCLFLLRHRSIVRKPCSIPGAR